MPDPSAAPVSSALCCPVCSGDVRFVKSVGAGGRLRWEVAVYVCPTDGLVYRTRQGLRGSEEDDGDRDALVPSPKRRAPTLNNAAIALPEPDVDDLGTDYSVVSPSR